MNTPRFSDDDKVLAMLCSYLSLGAGQRTHLKPLTPVEWDRLSEKLKARGEGPAALLNKSVTTIQSQYDLETAEALRIRRLLDRNAQLALELSRLRGMGIWIVTCADEQHYPQALSKLRARRPPILFGAGELELARAAAPRLAVIGPCRPGREGGEFTRALAQRCARDQIMVVSGGSKGTDRLALSACIKHRGRAIAVLPGELVSWLREKAISDVVEAGRLCLLTAYHPAAPFVVGHAVGRIKHIYAMADQAVIVGCRPEKGAIWKGARANFKSVRTPLFVRRFDHVKSGNLGLVNRGGVPISLEDLPDDVNLKDWLEQREHEHRAFVAATIEAEVPTHAGEDVIRMLREPEPEDLFPLIWPKIEQYLRRPRRLLEVREHFGIEQSQAKNWLNRAIREELAEKRRTKYVSKKSGEDGSSQQLELTLYP